MLFSKNIVLCEAQNYRGKILYQIISFCDISLRISRIIIVDVKIYCVYKYCTLASRSIGQHLRLNHALCLTLIRLANIVAGIQPYRRLYKLKICSKKECCKQCRHVKFKGTMTKWPVQKLTHKTRRTPRRNFFLFYILLACRSRQASIVLERYFRFEISLLSILCMLMEMGTSRVSGDSDNIT